jgi:hypothetical protein
VASTRGRFRHATAATASAPSKTVNKTRPRLTATLPQGLRSCESYRLQPRQASAPFLR